MIDTNNIIQDQNKTILVHVVMQISSYFKVKKKHITILSNIRQNNQYITLDYKKFYDSKAEPNFRITQAS